MNFIFLLSMSAVMLVESRRTKRLISGTKLEKEFAQYKAVEYFVWMGRTWDCYEDIPWWRKITPFNLYALGIPVCGQEKPNRGRFGGALITPQIVQTACHVLALFRDVQKQTWGATDIMHDWEDRMHAYMGQTDVKEFKYPIPVSHFVVHYNCSQLRHWPHYAKYDIGWVVLEKAVPESKGVSRGKWGHLDYAGPYKNAQLKEFHDKMVSQMHVCLQIGFGITMYTKGASMSQYLNHGWIQLMDYYTCYLTSYKLLDLDGVYDYPQTISWACSTPMRQPLGSSHTYGDSGTPISCDNIYFAVVSGTVGLDDKDIAGVKKLSMDTAIKYAPEANAVEYRKKFEDDVSVDGRYEPVKRDELRNFRPNFINKKLAQVSSVATTSSSGHLCSPLTSRNIFMLCIRMIIHYLSRVI